MHLDHPRPLLRTSRATPLPNGVWTRSPTANLGTITLRAMPDRGTSNRRPHGLEFRACFRLILLPCWNPAGSVGAAETRGQTQGGCSNVSTARQDRSAHPAQTDERGRRDATVTSACQSPFGGDVSAQGLTGGRFDKSVPLATAGPGGNPDWQPGDAVKFLPPQDIPTRGRASDVLASLPKEKLLTMYERMSTSRKWETAMKDLFLGAKDGLYGAFHTYVAKRNRGGCRRRSAATASPAPIRATAISS